MSLTTPPSSGNPPLHRYQDIRFCPRCGTAYRPQDFHRDECVFVCPHCTFDFYQNPLPSAVVVLMHPEQPESLLMMKRRTPPREGAWCVPGGFVKYGEAPEDAAAREVSEEAGLPARIGPVLRVGLLNYDYRGRQLCILEIAYLAWVDGPLAEALPATAEASEITFLPVADILENQDMLAFPEQAAVLCAFQEWIRDAHRKSAPSALTGRPNRAGHPLQR